MVNPEFEKWAQGFSGCDGGNPNGEIWVCGIEFGGGEGEANFRFDDATMPTYVGESTWGKDWARTFLNFPYNLRAAKLLRSLANKSDVDCVRFFEDEDCFGQFSNYFKLNLYPIAFQDTSEAHWHDWIGERTGIESKTDYLAWCRENRFPVLRQWVLKCSPKLIICTGITYVDEFFAAFTDGEAVTQLDGTPHNHIKYVVTNAGRTIVAVIYFLGGPRGLKGNVELTAAGTMLRGIYESVSSASAS